jgi:hypothetical protein
MSAPNTGLKAVTYAYPSSPDAVRFLGRRGRSRGCYCVELCQSDRTVRAITGGYEDSEAGRALAVEFARNLPNPWSPLHLRYNPEDAR